MRLWRSSAYPKWESQHRQRLNSFNTLTVCDDEDFQIGSCILHQAYGITLHPWLDDLKHLPLIFLTVETERCLRDQLSSS